jgi:putative ABC transport system substrate-binding protein
MKLLKKVITGLLCGLAIAGCKPKADSADTVTIGIIEPLEHNAMAKIVAGFTTTLQEQYHKPVVIKVENAQNDMNLERAIIQKMQAANYTMIVPIGVAATQMTLSMVHDKPVVSLASDFTKADQQKLQPCNVAVVHDEISAQQLLAFIHTTYPQLTHLTLVHSSADKVLPEVQAAIAAGKAYGITIHHVMVSSLPELYSAAQALPADTQGIFVLKDSLIVSGISTLAKVAAVQHIPLITSDQGSVQDGAGFALGVHEREIGVQGAQLAAAVLKGKAICTLPIVDMTNLTVFINEHALQLEKQDSAAIMRAAAQLHYGTETVNPIQAAINE